LAGGSAQSPLGLTRAPLPWSQAHEWRPLPDSRRLVKAQTPKAVLCVIRGGVVAIWIPKSLLANSQDYYRNYRGPILVVPWFAEKEGLDRFAIEDDADDVGAGSAESTTTGLSILVASTRVYRRLATKWHPDRNPQGGEVMRDLNELWQCAVGDVRGDGR
jgi:hypothetical protein